MKHIEKLKACTSLSSLAQLLGYKHAALAYLLYKLPSGSRYRHFQIPKKSGGVREIVAPQAQISALQSRVAELLGNCLAEIDGDGVSPSHGFRKHRSTFTNAARHVGRRFVFNCDLKDFFPSIHFGRVKGFFLESQHFKLHPSVAHALANLVCFNGVLPQGAPTSPVVSNLIGRILDFHLVKLARKNGLMYTRYADDLTFSTNKKSFPHEVGQDKGSDCWRVGSRLEKIIKQCGFSVNEQKTRMQYKTSRQEVTGVVVNTKVSVPVEKRRWARSAVHKLITTGEYYRPPAKNFIGPHPEQPVAGSMRRLEGLLSYIYSSHRHCRKTFLSSQNMVHRISTRDSALHSDEVVYQKFLHYAHFQHGSSPLLMCEGKTDNVYIKTAMQRLAPAFPGLVDASNKVLVRFHSHSEVSGRILGLNGGTSDLKNALYCYFDRCRKDYKLKPSTPLVVVVDDDPAGKDVKGWAQGVAKKYGVVTPDF